MTPLSSFGISLGIIVPENQEEIYDLLSRNGWINDINKLPNVGAFVAEVQEEFLAQKVGFLEGDVILKIDGKIGIKALTQIENNPFRELSEVEILRQNYNKVIKIKDNY